MNQALAGIRKPVVVAAIALTVLVGSIGLGSLAFAQEDGAATPTVEDQLTPDVEAATPVDDGTATDDGAASDDGTAPNDGSSDERSNKPECDKDELSDGTSTDATADAAGLTF